MSLPPLLQGIVIGFLIAAPVGPVGLLCMRRALVDGRLAGFVSGLGAATADALYGCLAALGLTALTAALDNFKHPIEIIGGLLMLAMGVHTYRTPPPAPGDERNAHAASLSTAYFSTFLLTVANPATLVALTFVLALFGINPGAKSFLDAVELIGGVFVGSALWWFLLTTGAGWFGSKLSAGTLRLINHVSGAVIFLIGFWQLGAVGFHWFFHRR